MKFYQKWDWMTFLFFLFSYIGFSMRQSKGHTHIFYVLFFFAVIVYFWKKFSSEESFQLKYDPIRIIRAAFISILVFSLLLIDDPVVYYKENMGVYQVFYVLLLVQAALAFFAFYRFKKNLSYQWILFLCFLFLFIDRALIPVISPNPYIDVFHINTWAVRDFLAGLNPYLSHYQDIYNGRYEYEAVFCYWPGILYGSAIAKVLFGDVRYLFVMSDLLAGLILWLMGRKNWIWPVLWFSFPIGFFVINQSWVDTLMVPWLFLAAFGIMRKSWFWTGLGLGVLCSVKQYAIFPAVFGVLVFYRAFGFTQTLKMSLLATLTTLGLILPMALQDFKAFYEITIAFFANQPMRVDSFTVNAVFYRFFKIKLSGKLTVIPIVLSFVPSVMWIWKKLKRNDSLHACWLWAGTLLIVNAMFFLFAKQAFANYYHYLACFSVLLLINKSNISRT